MWTSMIRRRLAPLLAATALLGGAATASPAQEPQVEIDTLEIAPEIGLRRMIVRNPHARGTVLFLHGFPETLYAWKGIALELGGEYEVHAFDWPGYGLSSRPPPGEFSYAPRDYARALKAYIERARIDTTRLTIYATDIGSLPALLLALQEPTIARRIIVGDFAPFDRPRHMHPLLQSLKEPHASESARAAMNRTRDDILANSYRRGFAKEEQFDIPQELKDDMLAGWSREGITSADAFAHYYSHFSADQRFFESQLARLKTPVKVVWGERDFYINKEMGVEFAAKAGLELLLLPGVGHYPHLQRPDLAVDEIRRAFRE